MSWVGRRLKDVLGIGYKEYRPRTVHYDIEETREGAYDIRSKALRFPESYLGVRDDGNGFAVAEMAKPDVTLKDGRLYYKTETLTRDDVAAKIREIEAGVDGRPIDPDDQFDMDWAHRQRGEALAWQSIKTEMDRFQDDLDKAITRDLQAGKPMPKASGPAS